MLSVNYLLVNSGQQTKLFQPIKHGSEQQTVTAVKNAKVYSLLSKTTPCLDLTKSSALGVLAYLFEGIRNNKYTVRKRMTSKAIHALHNFTMMD